MITSRRAFVTGLAAAIAAPAVVRSGLLMPVKVIQPARYLFVGSVVGYDVACGLDDRSVVTISIERDGAWHVIDYVDSLTPDQNVREFLESLRRPRVFSFNQRREDSGEEDVQPSAAPQVRGARRREDFLAESWNGDRERQGVHALLQEPARVDPRPRR